MKKSGECATFQYSMTNLSNTSVISLRDILGDMYNNYNYFYIVLNFFSGYNNSSSFTGGNYSAIRLTGLNFVHSTFQNNNGSSSSAIMPCSFVYGPNTQTLFTNSNTSGIVFSKSGPERVNLTVDIGLAFKTPFSVLISPDASPVYNNYMSFSIYGLYD